jgi:hypothetical protein
MFNTFVIDLYERDSNSNHYTPPLMDLVKLTDPTQGYVDHKQIDYN